MFEEILKSLYYYLAVLSIVSLFLLVRKNKRLALTFFLLFCFGITWRMCSRSNSSRYYSIFILYGILFASYGLNRIETAFKKKGLSIVPYAIVPIMLFVHVTKVFGSFSDKYILDLQEATALKAINNEVYIQKKEYERLKSINQKNVQIPETYQDLACFFVKSVLSGNKTFFVSSGSQLQLLKSLKLNANHNDLFETDKFITNRSHKKTVSISCLQNKDDLINSEIVLSPSGSIQLLKPYVDITNCRSISQDQMALEGKQIRVFSKRYFIVNDNTIQTSVKIKNIGENPARILIGFAQYANDFSVLSANNYPYKINNLSPHVISAQKGDKKIIVDNVPQWVKNGVLALNPQDDLSDVPNKDLIEGRIIEIKKFDTFGEIIIDKPLDETIRKGTKLRVHGYSDPFNYVSRTILQPGEEQIFSTSLQKDDLLLSFSPKAFSKGTYLVQPIIFSYSTDPNAINKVSIDDYTIKY